MSILLIRHGETELNATRVVQYPDTPLGDTGIEQAKQLGARLSQHPIARILTSDYQRAVMTAEHVSRQTQAETLNISLLRERHFGELRGKSYEQFEGVDIFARDYHPPGGESWEEFDARVDEAWGEVKAHAASIDGDLAVVTHGLVLRSLFERHIDLNGHDVTEELVVANTSITEVMAEPPWRVVRLACVAHLQDGPRQGGAV